MKFDLKSGIVLAAVAGFACSAAHAQTQGSKRNTPLRAHKVTQSAVAENPTWLSVNGVVIPPGAGNPTDDQFYIYQNGIGTTTHTQWFAASDPPDRLGWRALDDISFAGSYGAGAGGRTVNQVRFNITTTNLLLQAATTGVEVEMLLWRTLNTAGVPVVNTNQHPSVVRIAVPAPAAGWALNTIYFQSADLSGLAGGGWATGGEAFAVEFRYFLPGGTTANGLYHPDISVGFEGTSVENGTSADLYWADNNNGVPNGIMFEPGATGDALNFGGAAGTLANFAIGLRANVTLPTGACCLIDGTCDSTKNVQTCAGVGGLYHGDNSVCGTPACPPTGACCLGSGLCSTAPAFGCTALAGVYRGDGSCCGQIACPVGFDTGSPQSCNFNAAQPSYLGLISGNNGAGFENRITAQAFSLGRAATINEIDADFFVNIAFDTVYYKIYRRFPGTLPTDPLWLTPTAADLVASGSQPYIAANLVPDTRHPVGTFTIYPYTGLSIALPAGNYYLAVYGGNVGGGTGNFAWFTNAQLWAGHANTPIFNSSTAAGPFCWRGSSAPDVYPVYNPTNILIDTAPTFGPNPQSPNYVYNTAFIIKTLPPPPLCYPNCDSSTTLPCLNVLDFSCFLNSFAAGNCYANCDHSTTPPVLNVLDFSCFLNAFAAGCSNC